MSDTVNAFDWQSLGEGLVVDAPLVKPAKLSPHPRLDYYLVFQHRLSIIANGEAKPPLELKDHLIFQAHDFFNLDPVDHADVYLLRLTLRDWPDEDAVRILRNSVPKMTLKSRILINDSVIPTLGTIPLLQEKYNKNADMMMMSMFNPLERT
ncbi:hypothetical protein EV356DRAFT_508249 [Viridothelium virens]|uniref:O-methyltransferase C-terminal domain-containing protein n=1 Tax=Viridothelium virens TaxID=1048519 RepID=A0A6A6GZ60_VIRVR|nr:hypothetical protein EV356DRAFT_508249 [Viridothelium virens]